MWLFLNWCLKLSVFKLWNERTIDSFDLSAKQDIHRKVCLIHLKKAQPVYSISIWLNEAYIFTDFSWFYTYQKDISWHTLRHWFQNTNAIWLYINKYLMNSVELMESFGLHESLFSADWLICLLLDVVLPRKKRLAMKPLLLITHHTRTDPISHTWNIADWIRETIIHKL